MTYIWLEHLEHLISLRDCSDYLNKKNDCTDSTWEISTENKHCAITKIETPKNN